MAVIVHGSWIYNYLCKQCLSQLKGVSSNPAHGDVYSIQYYVTKFVIDNCGRSVSFSGLSTNITELLLKVALNTITPTVDRFIFKIYCGK